MFSMDMISLSVAPVGPGTEPNGEIYANAIADRLEAEGFKCFLDRKDYAPGDQWKGIGARKLEKTSQLIGSNHVKVPNVS